MDCMDTNVKLLFFFFSAHSDVASGLSDGNENVPASGGRHEGRTTKRHIRRSVRSRSRHEKSARPKLRILNVSIFYFSDSWVVMMPFFELQKDFSPLRNDCLLQSCSATHLQVLDSPPFGLNYCFLCFRFQIKVIV